MLESSKKEFNMGVIRVDEIFKMIDNVTEEEILEKCNSFSKDKIKNTDFDTVIDFLKEHTLFTDYILYTDNERAQKLLAKILNAFKIKEENLSEKIEYIVSNASMERVKIDNWEYLPMALITENDENNVLTCCCANFKTANKWGRETAPSKIKIIHNKNRHVIWIKNDYKDPSYFISFGEEIYAINYEHKKLIIYKNIGIISKKIIVNEEYDNLDDIVKENDNDYLNKCEEIKIDLSEYFPIGFFYRGPQWTKEWKELYPNGIIDYKEIIFVNGFLKIEIENISYPHKGYVLLDIKNFVIIEAKKYEK